MKNIQFIYIPLIVFTIWATPCKGQLPEQDCFSAIPICETQVTQNVLYTGAGTIVDEINPQLLSCSDATAEINSVWYTFQIESEGSLCFTLTPLNPSDNFNWSLFNLTNATCSLIGTQPGLEVACNYAAPNLAGGCDGNTGADSLLVAPCGEDNTECITVTSGQIFALHVNNPTVVQNGYTLDFSNSTASLLDTIAPEMVAVAPSCGGVIASFSENILCSSVDASDFTFDGPGGPYTVSQVQSVQCDSGGSYDRSFFLGVEPAIQNADNFTLSLVGTLTDVCNNSASLSSLDVTMVPNPISEISSQDSLCFQGHSFNFEYGGNSPNLTTFAWDLGDGTQQGLRSFSYTYTNVGPQTVSLTITNDLGCSDTTEKTILLIPNPQANFLLPPSQCQGDSAIFTSTSSIDTPFTLIRYAWDFGNGQVSSDSSAIQLFSNSGQQTVSLTVFGTNNCSASISQNYTVSPAPTVDFTTDGPLCINQPIQFINRSTAVSGSINSTSLNWDFGDGTIVTGNENPVHSFGSTGTFLVQLQASTDQGCTDSLNQSFTLIDMPIPQIIEDSSCVGSSIRIEAIPPADAFTYWYVSPTDTVPELINDFLQIDPIQNDTTLYVEAVSFDGCASERIPISAFAVEPANLDLSVSDTTLVFPFTGVFFGLNGFTSIESIFWDFGDGNTSTDTRPFHIYERDGQFEVSLSIVDAFGCAYEFTQNLEITKPVTAFIPSAFSPNGDGINEEFFVSSQLLGRFLIQIFDRFGNEIFRSFDPEFSWDGTYKGDPVPEGVYAYRFRGIDVTGLLIEDEGTITLIR
ncbi:MAG: PKD domain-containing protein [Bacteroidota bacterium]